MTVSEIQAHVGELSAEELKDFSTWFERYLADQWDRQIEADALNGNIDRMVKRLGIKFDTDLTETLTAGLAQIADRTRPA